MDLYKLDCVLFSFLQSTFYLSVWDKNDWPCRRFSNKSPDRHRTYDDDVGRRGPVSQQLFSDPLFIY